MPITVYPSTNNPRLVKKLWIFTQGAWRQLKGVFIFSGGGWRKLYSSEFDPITITGGTDVNLREQWRGRYPGETPTGNIKITVTGNCTASSNSNYGLRTGDWPTDVRLTIDINPGIYVVGKGGTGATGRGGGGAGGPAMYISIQNVTINNYGIIGGGGGGGAGGATPSNCCGNMCGASGGGGAGFGAGGSNCVGTAGTGSINAGGAAARINWRQFSWYGGNGGNLGVKGQDASHDASNINRGGAPGASIVRAAGATYTLVNAGTVVPAAA